MRGDGEKKNQDIYQYMGGLSVHRCTDGTIWSTSHDYIKEGKTTIRLWLHSELDSSLDPIEVLQQVLDSA